jgi:tetratricopeptide (TPR) repeat protein
LVGLAVAALLFGSTFGPTADKETPTTTTPVTPGQCRVCPLLPPPRCHPRACGTDRIPRHGRPHRRDDGPLGAIGPVPFIAATVLGSIQKGLARVFDSIWKGLETMRAPAATAIALLGVVALLMALRNGLLSWHARKPRVQISILDWAGAADVDKGQAAWVTSLLRSDLAALRVSPFDALPERAPGAPLVEIFAGVGQGSAVGKAMAGVASAVTPDFAYAVWGSLRPHDDGRGGQVSVELVDRSRRNKTLISVTVAGTNWERCTREAAMAVAGALYPQVRRRYQGPWTQWTHPVPRTLVTDYHDALAYERADRLEEAIGAYHRALRQDPLNPHLRLSIAMVLERLGLYLDAWATYQAVSTETDRKAWKGPERRVRLLALYRQAIILGYEKAGEQWMRPDHAPRTLRDRERQTLRAELALGLLGEHLFTGNAGSTGTPLHNANAEDLWPSLHARLQTLALTPQPQPHPNKGTAEDLWADPPVRPQTLAKAGEPAPADPRACLLELLCGDPDTPTREDTAWPFLKDNRVGRGDSPAKGVLRVDLINELLQITALRRLKELQCWLRPWPPLRTGTGWWRHRPSLHRALARRELAPKAVDLAIVWIRLRLRATRFSTVAQHADDESYELLVGKPPFKKSRAGRVRVGAKLSWPGPRNDGWLIHYNAACTVAVPLLPEIETDAGTDTPLHPQKEEALAAIAVAHLEKYAHKAGSARVASQESWIGAHDPDLAGITEHARFQEWARHHLSERLPKQRAPRSTDIGRHLRVVLQAGARSIAADWHTRARGALTSIEAVESWWRDDQQMWKLIAEACVEFRSWCPRLAAMEAVTNRLTAAGAPPITSTPAWQEGDAGSSETHEEWLRDIAGQVSVVGGNTTSSPTPGPVLKWIDSRLALIRTARLEGVVQVGDAGFDAAEERAAALQAFRLWTALAEALDPAAPKQARADWRAAAVNLPAIARATDAPAT